MSRRIFVLGGAGFVFSNFIHYWTQKYPADFIYVLDNLTYAGRLSNLFGDKFVQKEFSHKGWTWDAYKGLNLPQVTLVRGAIEDPNILRNMLQWWGADLLILGAAQSHVDNSLKAPLPFVRTNIEGTLQVLEACKEYKVPLYHISTDEVLSHSRVLGAPVVSRLSEDASYGPHNPYSATKAAAEHLCSAYRNSFDMDITVLRLCNMYGGRQHEEKFIPKAITSLLRGTKVPLYTPGNQIRDWLYVEDACRAMDLIIHTEKEHNLYHISAYNERDNYSLLQIILNKLGISWEEGVELVKDRLGHDPIYALNSDRVRDLGWTPKVSLSDGLDKTIAYYKDQLK